MGSNSKRETVRVRGVSMAYISNALLPSNFLWPIEIMFMPSARISVILPEGH